MKGKKLITTICIVCVLATLLCIPAFATVTESDGDGYALYNGVKLPALPRSLDLDDTYMYTASAQGLTSTGNYYVDGVGSRSDGSLGTIHYLYTINQDVVSALNSQGITNAVLGAWFEVPNVSSFLTLTPFWCDFQDTDFISYTSPEVLLDGLTVFEWDGQDGLVSGESTYVNFANYIPVTYAVGVINYDNAPYTATLFSSSSSGWSLLGNANLFPGIVAAGSVSENESRFIKLISTDGKVSYGSLFAYRSTESPPDEGGGDDDDPQPPAGG